MGHLPLATARGRARGIFFALLLSHVPGVSEALAHAVGTACQGGMMAAPTPGSILVIDDEPSIVRGLTRLLHRDGYRVATARNGRDALAQRF